MFSKFRLDPWYQSKICLVRLAKNPKPYQAPALARSPPSLRHVHLRRMGPVLWAGDWGAAWRMGNSRIHGKIHGEGNIPHLPGGWWLENSWERHFWLKPEGFWTPLYWNSGDVCFFWLIRVLQVQNAIHLRSIVLKFWIQMGKHVDGLYESTLPWFDNTQYDNSFLCSWSCRSLQ